LALTFKLSTTPALSSIHNHAALQDALYESQTGDRKGSLPFAHAPFFVLPCAVVARLLTSGAISFGALDQFYFSVPDMLSHGERSTFPISGI
jgi:hypothetical protein